MVMASISVGVDRAMLPFTRLDLVALLWFVASWVAYAAAMEWSPHGRKSLKALMDSYRAVWMRHRSSASP